MLYAFTDLLCGGGAAQGRHGGDALQQLVEAIRMRHGARTALQQASACSATLSLAAAGTDIGAAGVPASTHPSSIGPHARGQLVLQHMTRVTMPHLSRCAQGGWSP